MALGLVFFLARRRHCELVSVPGPRPGARLYTPAKAAALLGSAAHPQRSDPSQGLTKRFDRLQSAHVCRQPRRLSLPPVLKTASNYDPPWGPPRQSDRRVRKTWRAARLRDFKSLIITSFDLQQSRRAVIAIAAPALVSRQHRTLGRFSRLFPPHCCAFLPPFTRPFLFSPIAISEEMPGLSSSMCDPIDGFAGSDLERPSRNRALRSARFRQGTVIEAISRESSND